MKLRPLPVFLLILPGFVVQPAFQSSASLAAAASEAGVVRLSPVPSSSSDAMVFRLSNASKWPSAVLVVSEASKGPEVVTRFCGLDLTVASRGESYAALLVAQLPPDSLHENINVPGRWIVVPPGAETQLRIPGNVIRKSGDYFAVEVRFPWQLDCSKGGRELNPEFKVRVGYRAP